MKADRRSTKKRRSEFHATPWTARRGDVASETLPGMKWDVFQRLMVSVPLNGPRQVEVPA